MSEYTDKQIARRPAEAARVRKIIRAMKAGGSPVTFVFDGGEMIPVRTEAEIFEQVFGLDEVWLYTTGGAWVFLVMGEDPEDMPTDYTMDLDHILKEI